MSLLLITPLYTFKRFVPIFFVHFYERLLPILVNLVTLDPDPDPGGKKHVDPWGSGSKTLLFTGLKRLFTGLKRLFTGLTRLPEM